MQFRSNDQGLQILLKIDGNNVYKAPATRVADLLLGPSGSEVERHRRYCHQMLPGRWRSSTGIVLTFLQIVRAKTDPQQARTAMNKAYLTSITSSNDKKAQSS
eukprot:759129-Hanusia_phi.AAC.1